MRIDVTHQVATALHAVGLEKIIPAVMPYARSSLQIHAVRCKQEDLALGASRFGGMPDLPAGFRWPIFQGLPLLFVAQFDLSTLPRAAASCLPASGWLVFFYDTGTWGFDPADRGSVSVAFVTGSPTSLIRTKSPTRNEYVVSFQPCRLSFAEVIDIPDEFDGLFPEMNLGLSDAEQERYAAAALMLQGRQRDDEHYHHLLGLPQPVQFDMRLQCQLVTNGIYCGNAEGYADENVEKLAQGTRDWMLLLQIDTDEDGPGWMWGDTGRIYFWIRKQDLDACDYAKSWLILQCG
jgi:uncharacterized protein YwqG